MRCELLRVRAAWVVTLKNRRVWCETRSGRSAPLWVRHAYYNVISVFWVRVAARCEMRIFKTGASHCVLRWLFLNLKKNSANLSIPFRKLVKFVTWLVYELFAFGPRGTNQRKIATYESWQIPLEKVDLLDYRQNQAVQNIFSLMLLFTIQDKNNFNESTINSFDIYYIEGKTT